MLEIKPIFKALLRSKVGAVLLLLQIAITTAIVSNAAFIIKDRAQYLNQPTGYAEEDLFSFNIMTFGKGVDVAKQLQIDLDVLRKMPGVVDASATNAVPLSGSGSAGGIGLIPEPNPGKKVRSAYLLADGNILNTLGANVIEGRAFTPDEFVLTKDDDVSNFPKVLVVTKTFANELFPEGDALDKTVYFGEFPGKIIGIVDDIAGPWLKDTRPFNVIFIPLIMSSTNQSMIVRTQPGMRDSVMKQVESVLLEQYSQRVINWLDGFDEQKDNYNAGDLLMLRMLFVLIVVLVLVTVLGIFGLTLFNINKRTKQIGTRRALGARKSAIIRYFLVENGLICIAGLVIGALGALLLGQQLMQHYELAQLPPVYIVVTCASVFVMSLLAVLPPAKRAAEISPSIATRSI